MLVSSTRLISERTWVQFPPRVQGEKDMLALVAIIGIGIVISSKLVPVERTFEQQSSSGSAMPTAGTITGVAKIISSLK